MYTTIRQKVFDHPDGPNGALMLLLGWFRRNSILGLFKPSCRRARRNGHAIFSRQRHYILISTERHCFVIIFEKLTNRESLWRRFFTNGFTNVFTDYYHSLAEEAEGEFEQACKAYDAERDGIENDPCKKFKPSTEFEIYQELKAYFEEQGTLH